MINRTKSPTVEQVFSKTVVELIAAKRDGHSLSPDEIETLIREFQQGGLADYQMTAFLMAVFFRGLSDDETAALTQSMLHSGSVLDLSSVPGIKVDKHSTGGVGDKVSLCLAPLVAACGVPVPMVSGRGLGHTGGTLDKLESIPGFRTDLSVAKFAEIVRDVGVCMIGQTREIAPADKRIYALRDVTATVECIPLIVASILSKKLAEGIDALVLDVKVGRGAFMKDVDQARKLAHALVRVATQSGKRAVALLTDMNTPLGLAVGNSNETREAFEVLGGGGPADLIECTLALGAEMLMVGGKASSLEDARARLSLALKSGDAVRVMEKMVAAQGGDARVVAEPWRLELAPEVAVIEADRNGVVVDIDPLEIGLAAVAIGAGRTRADQAVDWGVGIELEKRVGDSVAPGEPLARLRGRDKAAGEAIAERVRRAIQIGKGPAHVGQLVIDRIEL